jgi:1,4-dihydroxy-2-naphthoate polyprenyltransferase
MATRAQWVSGARPRTLPVAVAPVLVGTGAAVALGPPVADSFGWFSYAPVDGAVLTLASWGWAQLGQAVLAMIVALALQVAVNYANDYSDGIRGTDDNRVGPFRLTGSGAAAPSQVKLAALAAFGVAGVAGFALIAWTGHWWLLAVGVACTAAAWYYTGGQRPYGYAGLGEVAVFVFFGLVAVLGTTYTQSGRVGWAAIVSSIGIGALACAVLVANNLRDVPTDAESGKVTVAVRIGDVATRQLYAALLGVPVLTTLLAAPLHPAALLAWLAIPLALAPLRTVLSGASGLALLPVLRDTGRLELVYAVLLAVGLAL